MRMPMMALVLFLVACASGAPGAAPRNADILTLEEIQSSDYGNAYDVIRSMRPAWLRTRGANSINLPTPIMVYVDGMRAGTIEELSTIPKISIERMRYWSPVDAQARWGLNNTNGAIEVITRRS